MNFNPRAPCGARRRYPAPRSPRRLFQPTRPLRGATVVSHLSAPLITYFNPRAPCGARRRRQYSPLWPRTHFNPRAPCGARRFLPGGDSPMALFQPTRPLRGATALASIALHAPQISTHAPLAGRDRRAWPNQLHIVDISTHAPLAGRDAARKICWLISIRFQPTRPLRGATLRDIARHRHIRISTHAPLAGRDRWYLSSLTVSVTNFNPRAPCGARRY